MTSLGKALAALLLIPVMMSACTVTAGSAVVEASVTRPGEQAPSAQSTQSAPTKAVPAQSAAASPGTDSKSLVRDEPLAEEPAAMPAAGPVDFGFWHVDTGRSDANDASGKTDFTDEVAPFSTIVHIQATGNPSASVVPKLVRAKDSGMRAVLFVVRLVFQNGRLRKDYKALVDAFAENNRGYLTSEYVKALEFIDEPYWRNENRVPSCADESAGATPYAELAEAAAYLKEKIPGVPLYFSESHNCADELRIPPEVDYVSLHYYGVKDPAGWDPFKREQGYYLNRIRTLAGKLGPHQKLWIVMDAQYDRARYWVRSGIAPKDMAAVTRNYWNLACRAEFRGKVDTVFAYRWPSPAARAADGNLGARELGPAVQDLYRQIYRQVKNGTCDPLD